MYQWQAKHESLLPPPPLPMPTLLWGVLSARGLKTASEVESFYSPKLKDLTNPFKLDHMKEAVDRLIKAFINQESVCIYGDFDLDGTSGIAILTKAFKDLGYKNISYYQPKRLSEGYGVHAKALETLKASGVNLVVTVDVGITAVEAIDRAHDIGLDVIVTDHHLPKAVLPNAVAIINPNKGTCSSGLGHLCGAGVGFYLCLALKSQLEQRGLITHGFDAKELLDCFAIGTLTDLVPLVKENRVLVKHGLRQLQNTNRPGLKALMHELGLGDQPLTASDVAIRFAPKLNALSRLETSILPVDIFLEEDEFKAQKLVSEVIEINNKRVELQNKAQLEAEAHLSQSAQKRFIFIASDKFHQGVVGLVATRLAQAYNVPAFIGAIKEGGVIVGSARLPGDGQPSLLDAFECATKALTKFGGHAQAAGFEMSIENMALFEAKLSEHYENTQSNNGPNTGPICVYESPAFFKQINPEFMSWLEGLEPFGKEFETPIFCFNNLIVKSVKNLRGGHLKLSLQCSKSKVLRDGLWFSPPAHHELIKSGLKQGIQVSMLAGPQWNHFNGKSSIQFLIKDLKLS